VTHINFIATATFGLEAVVKRELTRLGMTVTGGGDGRVDFCGGFLEMARANVHLRASDRVLLVMGEFEALTFEELFEQTKALPWEDIISEDGNFSVDGKSIKSALFSVPDCQRIVEKAVVERLKTKYKLDWFPKTGAVYKIQVALLKDKATLTIDTTGAGLHKRGYRPVTSKAPIRETLAAAMIDLSFWRKDRAFLDPMCGSGTIAIEAALIAKGIPAGLNRSFVSENWECADKSAWDTARGLSHGFGDCPRGTPTIFASDIDPKLIAQAKENAQKAGVSDIINFSVADIKDITLPKADYGIIITNPPYGQRIGEQKNLPKLYKQLKRLMHTNPTWGTYVITSDENFERDFGHKAHARRKLFNGNTKTNYYQYHPPKPPRV